MTTAVIPKPPKWYTYKKDCLAACQEGQTPSFFKGHGWYCKPIASVVPPPPPGINPVLPVGPFTKTSQPVNYPDASKAGLVDGLDIENIKGAVNGLSIMQWPPKDGPKWNVKNIIVQNVGNVPPTSNGTREAGIWIGQPADLDGIVSDGSWESLWTGAMCHDSNIKNITLAKRDSAGNFTLPAGGVASLYCEHFTRRTTFSQMRIIPIGSKAIISEWWYPDSTYAPFVAQEYPNANRGEAGSCMNIHEDLYVWCPKGGYGIYLDQGTWGDVTQRITFDGPGNAYKEVGPLHGPIPNTYNQASCTYLNGGTRMEHEYGDPKRKVPEAPAHVLYYQSLHF